MTKWLERILAFLLAGLLSWVCLLLPALVGSACFSLPAHAATANTSSPTKAAGDPQHDFDFNFGTWHTHIRRILDPFAGATHAIELNGTVTVHRVWGGRAQLEEIEADGPNGHWEGLTLFLYNPASRQWSQSFVNSRSGVLSTGLVGAFRDGRGELYAHDTYQGREILVRGVWSAITPNTHHYEESYSDDGGASWSPVFMAELTRLHS